MRLTATCNEPKLPSGWLELLQLVLELDIEQCASEDVGPQKGWIVRSHVTWRGE